MDGIDLIDNVNAVYDFLRAIGTHNDLELYLDWSSIKSSIGIGTFNCQSFISFVVIICWVYQNIPINRILNRSFEYICRWHQRDESAWEKHIILEILFAVLIARCESWKLIGHLCVIDFICQISYSRWRNDCCKERTVWNDINYENIRSRYRFLIYSFQLHFSHFISKFVVFIVKNWKWLWNRIKTKKLVCKQVVVCNNCIYNRIDRRRRGFRF